MPTDLTAEAFHFILLFARLSAAAQLLPGLGEQDIPTSIRLALGLSWPFLRCSSTCLVNASTHVLG